MEEDVIYLDYAANTPVDENVLNVFNRACKKYIANPNSTHKLGNIAKEQIDKSTNNILNLLKENAKIDDNMEVIYTSGSSESNNLAIKGVARSYRQNGKHIITTFLEHSSISSPLTSLKEQGYEIDILNIDKNLNVDFTKFTIDDFITGINIELEHGKVNPLTNVTNNDLLTTAKIALAHLNEFPNYYNKNYGLPAFEKFLKINQKM